MVNKKLPTDSFKKKLELMISNGADISDLITDYDIKGLDLSRAVIKRISRFDEDLTNTNFSNTIIGETGASNFLFNCTLVHCNFTNCKVEGKFSIRKSNCQRAIFRNAWMPELDYSYGDFRGTTLCNFVIPIDSNKMKGITLSIDDGEKLFKNAEIKLDGILFSSKDLQDNDIKISNELFTREDAERLGPKLKKVISNPKELRLFSKR